MEHSNKIIGVLVLNLRQAWSIDVKGILDSITYLKSIPVCEPASNFKVDNSQYALSHVLYSRFLAL